MNIDLLCMICYILVLLLLDSDSYELFNSIGLSRKNESDKFGSKHFGHSHER